MTHRDSTLTYRDALDALAICAEVLSVAQAAAAIGLSEVTVRRRIADGSLRAIRTQPGRGGQYRILKTDLAALLVGMSS